MPVFKKLPVLLSITVKFIAFSYLRWVPLLRNCLDQFGLWAYLWGFVLTGNWCVEGPIHCGWHHPYIGCHELDKNKKKSIRWSVSQLAKNVLHNLFHTSWLVSSLLGYNAMSKKCRTASKSSFNGGLWPWVLSKTHPVASS